MIATLWELQYKDDESDMEGEEIGNNSWNG